MEDAQRNQRLTHRYRSSSSAPKTWNKLAQAKLERNISSCSPSTLYKENTIVFDKPRLEFVHISSLNSHCRELKNTLQNYPDKHDNYPNNYVNYLIIKQWYGIYGWVFIKNSSSRRKV